MVPSSGSPTRQPSIPQSEVTLALHNYDGRTDRMVGGPGAFANRTAVQQLVPALAGYRIRLFRD